MDTWTFVTESPDTKPEVDTQILLALKRDGKEEGVFEGYWNGRHFSLQRGRELRGPRHVVVAWRSMPAFPPDPAKETE